MASDDPASPSATADPGPRPARGLAAAWAAARAWLCNGGARPDPRRLLVPLLPVLLVGVAYVSAQSASVVNDAHSYIDEFNDNTGINLPASSGVQNLGGVLDANASTMTVVSNCFALPQPAGGTFNRWLFAEIGLANLASVTSSSLQVQTCAGAALATYANPAAGTRSYDIGTSVGSTPSIRFVYTATHSGTPGGSVTPARLSFWRAYGEATGAVNLAVVPSATSLSVNGTVTMSMNVSTTGAVARNAELVFSMDDINGLSSTGAAQAPDDGLNEDAEVDYGNGGGLGVFRPILLESQSNAPNGNAATSTVAGSNRGTLTWALGDLPSGFTGTVTLSLRVPPGYAIGRNFAARARLRHGATPVNSLPGLQTTQTVTATSTSVAVSAGNSNWGIGGFRPSSQVAPGQVNAWDSVGTATPNTSNTPDAENVRITHEYNLGTCIPIFRSFTPSNYAAPYTHRLISAPTVGQPATTPLVYHHDRVPFFGDARTQHFFDVPSSCANGSTISIRTTVVYGNPARTLTTTRDLAVVVNYCPNPHNWTVQRIANGPSTTWDRWPQWADSDRTGGAIQAGEFFATWLRPFASSNTVTVDRSYTLVTLPPWATFHGVSDNTNITRIYKDSTGTAPAPGGAGFVPTNDPPHPSWRPVTATDIGTSPFTAAPNDNNPSAVVLPGTRLLVASHNLGAGATNVFEGVLRMGDGTYGVPERAEGNATTTLLTGTNHVWETGSNPAGVFRDCGSVTQNGVNHTKEAVSYPTVVGSAAPNLDVAAGQTTTVRLFPVNNRLASQPVQGTWVVNLFDVRDRVDLAGVIGTVNANSRFWPPGADPASVTFTAPNASACLAATSADDPACMARWSMPNHTQPWPTYGTAGTPSNYNSVLYPFFQLQLPVLRNAPAGQVLPVRVEVRRTDLSARGADNAVSTARHAASNYTAVVNLNVLEAPELATTLSAPATWPHNSTYTAQLLLENRGNAPAQGFYTVLRLPRAGVGGSQFTPVYERAYLTRPMTDLLLETSTDSSCLANPLGVAWTAQTLQTSTRSGYQAQTAAALPAGATCLRVRRNPASSYTFNAGLSVTAAVDIGIVNNPALGGQNLALRAASGSSTTLGSTANFGPLETADRVTQVSDAVVTGGTKAALPDLTRAGWVRWSLRWSNQSGITSGTVAVTDTLPAQLIYRGLASALPSGVTCVDPGCAVVGAAGDGSGGQLRLSVATLGANDGVSGSGADEGTVDIWAERKAGVADGSAIENCLTTAPAGSGNIGSNSCTTVGNGRITATLAQTVVPAQGGSPPIVSPNDVLRYTLTLSHQESSARHLRVHDALPAGTTYVPGSFSVDGAAAGDGAFSGGTFAYTSASAVAASTNHVLQYSVRVNTGTANGTTLSNTAVATPCTNNSDVGSCSLGKEASATTAQVVANAAISGTVFEDRAYGGGAGRSLAGSIPSGGSGRPNVRVELYDSATGDFFGATTTDANGNYSFTGLGARDWVLRVVGAGVTSGRSGSTSTLRGVMTYRTAWNGTANAGDGNRVGGESPGLQDAPDNTTSQTLAAINAVSGQVAQNVAPVRTTVGTLSGIDFGFNFNTLVNTNDNGAGSLRQVITNASALGGDATLNQAGRLPGSEHVIFMLGNGSSAAGLRAANNFFTTNGGSANVATITVASGLPGFGALTVDAQTQPGWNSASPRPIIEINAAAGGSFGFLLTNSATVRGFIIHGAGRQIHLISAGGGGNLVQGNWLGLNAAGTAGVGGSACHGLSAQSPFNVIGGTTAAERNVASGNGCLGIVLETSGATGNRVVGNYVGTNAEGTAAVGNAGAGIGVYLSANGNQIGGAVPGEGNLASGNGHEGIGITTSNNTVQGNRIGTNALGTTAVANGRRGVIVQGSNNTIGGSAAGQGNLISGNGTSLSDETHAGIVVNGAATGVVIAGNTIGLAADGITALGNRKNSIYIADQSAVTVGGATAAHRNLIAAANSHGVLVSANGNAGVTIQNNWIGLAVDGSTARGNGLDGVVVWAGASSNVNVLSNVIAGSGRYGVWFANGTGHAVRGNFIGTDSGGALARANAGGGVYINGSGTTATIGGATNVDRNVVSGNGAFGISFETGATGAVQGNYVGTSADGTGALGNNGPAVWLNGAAGVTVGGAATGAGNVLAASTSALGGGLRVEGGTATGNLVYGNLIGRNAANTGNLANAGSGLGLAGGANGNTIGGTAAGQANVIGGNALAGIGFDTTGGAPLRNRISGNSIFGNNQKGIRLDNSSTPLANDGATSAAQANNGMDSPVLTSAVLSGNTLNVTGYVGSAAGQSTFGNAVVELFAAAPDASGFGEGRTYLGSVTADASGNFGGTVTLPVGVTLTAGTSLITGTATDANGNTSEFGANAAVQTLISGRVFEDANYGGGAGRTRAAASGVGRANAVVELYSSTGTWLAGTTTDSNGDYAFVVNASNTYQVRVVNSSVSSARSGWVTGLLPVQTFRTQAVAGVLSSITDHVGGANPALADAAANTTTAALSTLSTASTTAQSLASIAVAGTDIAGVDFGFNFSTVVNTNDSGQGSLRQFITNANTLDGQTGLAQNGSRINMGAAQALPAGVETSIFMIPAGSVVPGLRAGLPSQLTSGVARIVAGSELPALTRAQVALDGSTQTANVGDTNGALLGTGGAVGVDAVPLGRLGGPEVELSGAPSVANGLQISANNGRVRGLAIYGFNVAVRLAGGTNVLLEQNVIGSRATSFTDPGPGIRTAFTSVFFAGIGSGTQITNNLIGFSGQWGISTWTGSPASDVTVQGNEVRNHGIAGTVADGISPWAGSNRWTIVDNLVVANRGIGIDAEQTGTAHVIRNNTVSGNGTANSQIVGILLGGTGHAVSKNIVTNHPGSGISLATGAAQSLITQNSTYGNNTRNTTGLAAGISLGGGITGASVKANDGSKTAGQPNQLMDHPVLTAATLTGSNLTLIGYVGTAAGQTVFAGALVDVYVADGNASGFGEGQTYLGTLTADGSGNFSGSLTVPGTVALTTAVSRITATATDGQGNTSEFGPNFTLANPYTVTNTQDSGAGSLRQALTNAIADAGAQTISFNIPATDPNLASGVWTITPASALPQVTDTTLIDASTQPGYVGVPLVQIRGTAAGAGSNGLRLMTAGGSTVRGLVINGFGGCAVRLDAPGGHTVAGNYIGTDITGSAAASGNGAVGVCVNSSSNTVGGTGANDRNVIGGFVQVSTVQGRGIDIALGANSNAVASNYVGLGADGVAAVPNQTGVFITDASSNTIGGNTTAHRNVISGNQTVGVLLQTSAGSASGNVVAGNYIGTNAAGTAPVANLVRGVGLSGNVASTTIGGGVAGAGNLISGNPEGIRQQGAGITGTVIRGNWVGLNAAGTARFNGATSVGVNIASGGAATIGGTGPHDRNIISGASSESLRVDTTGSVVQGNWIGLNAAGDNSVTSGVAGIWVGATGAVTIGGTTPEARNLIIGFYNVGLRLSGSGSVVQGNWFGLTASATAPITGSQNAIEVSGSGHTIGGAAAGAGNVVTAYNQRGMLISGSNVTVHGNIVGRNPTNTANVWNGGIGIVLAAGASNVAIGGLAAGEGNVVAGSFTQGVQAQGGSGNPIRGNSIWGNGRAGIDLVAAGDPTSGATPNDGAKTAGQPNLLMDSPVLTRAVLGSNTLSVVGYVGSAALQATFGGALVDLYVSNGGQGQTYIGTVTANADGEFAGVVSTAGVGGLVAGTTQIVATATDGSGNTSEFGNSVATTALAALSNGSFESGVTPGGWIRLASGNSTSLPGWVVTGSDVDYHNDFLAADGSRSVDLQGGSTRGGIVQFAQTVPGQTYTLTFAFAANPACERGVKTLRVTAGSSTASLDFSSVGRVMGAPGWVDRSLVFTATSESSLIWFSTPTTGNCGPAVDNVGLGTATATATLTGTVFEDVNYGGGAGRAMASAAGHAVRSGARVELFGASGNFILATTTNASGSYIFSGLDLGNYTVRVVSSSVTSSRTGYTVSLLPVVTYRTNASGGFATADAAFVGGANPALADAGDGSTTLAALTSASTTAQAITPVQLAGNITGLDFGFSFNVVTNTRDSGSGSLRQAITNANALDDGGLAQAGRTPGIEHIVFMLPNGSSAAGLRSSFNAFTTNGGSAMVATFTPGSAYPTVSSGVVLDAQTQPGWTSRPLLEISGALLPPGFANRVLYLAGANILRGFIVNRGPSAADAIRLDGNNQIVQGNWVGLDATGTAAAANGRDGIALYGTAALIGGASSTLRNVISGNARFGVDDGISGAANHVIVGNYIGTNADGTAAVPNGDHAINLDTSTGNRVGGPNPGEGNVISGNTQSGVNGGASLTIEGNLIGLAADGITPLGNGNRGIQIGGASSLVLNNVVSSNVGNGVLLNSGASGTVLRGNVVGLAADGTTARGNGGSALLVQCASGCTIGGSATADRNVISASTAGHGIELQGANSVVRGNYIGTDRSGTLARGTTGAFDGIRVSGSGHAIGGVGAGNTISGNGQHGINVLSGASALTIVGNTIGTNAAGTAALPNAQNGVLVAATGITVGGTAPGSRNVISGNGQGGVRIEASNATVQGNYIGVNAAGTAAIANGAVNATNGGVWVTAGSGHLIGGTATGAGNVLSGNWGAGVKVEPASTGGTIQGNLIGTNAAGDAALGNNNWGIGMLGSGWLIGGSATNAGNVVSGNTGGTKGGISIWGNNVTVQGNTIGLNLARSAALPNGSGGAVFDGGIDVRSGSNIQVGGIYANEGNVIAGNAGKGVRVSGSTTQVAIRGNSIYGNSGLGIDLFGSSEAGDVVTANDNAKTTTEPNQLMDHPVFTAAALAGDQLFVSGHVGAAPSQALFANSRVEVFVSDNDSRGFGEGQTYIGFVTTDASGNFNGRLTLASGITITAGSTRVTATATDSAGNTSEFGANVIVTAGIAGRVYEDVNYGGGPGRDWLTAMANGGAPRPDVRVEYGSVSGGVVTVQGFVITAADGSYVVPTPGAGTFAVRVPTGGVPSSRTGYGAGLLPVLTFLADAPAGSLVARADRVGGTDPAATDAGDAGAGATFSSSTGVFSSGAAGTAHAFALVQVGASAALAGVDFGFHFSTVVNTRDSGQGSLRQAILNANALGGDASLQTAGRAAGVEHLVFMIPNGTAGAGGALNLAAGGLRSGINYFTGSTAALQPLTALPVVSEPLVLDAQTQPGWTNAPLIELNGGSAPAAGGFVISAAGSQLRGFVIHGFANSTAVRVSAANVQVQGNWVGLAANGDTVSANAFGITLDNAPNGQVGGTTAAQRNVVSGNASSGIWIAGNSQGSVVAGNYIGTNATGSAARNTGIKPLYVTSPDVLLGGTAPGAGNLVSGNSGDSGVWLSASGTVMHGNVIGLNAAGTAALPNFAGMHIQDATNLAIGGNRPEERNVISGNSNWGIHVKAASTTNVVIRGNTIGLDASGDVARGNGGTGLWAWDAGSGLVIGGSAPGEGNLIAGSGGDGIHLQGTSNGALVQGNWIGLNAAGTAARSNHNGILVEAANAQIGGSQIGSRNVISGNRNDGVYISGGGNNATVQGNYIGTDPSGMVARPNGRLGIIATNGAANPRIGGSVPGSGNLISGNTGTGLAIATFGAVVEGNVIGRNLGNTADLPNGGHGVSVGTGYPSLTTIGGTAAAAANVIAGNSGSGVRVTSAGTTATIRGNSVFGNANRGIDLVGPAEPANGVTPNDGAKTSSQPNQLMDHPVFTSARARGNQLTVAGYVGSAAGQSVFANARVEVFASDEDAAGFGEGRTYLGFVTTDASGNFSGTVTMPVAVLRIGTRLTATATDASGSTSEFGANFANLVVDNVVNHNGDAPDANPGDGLCETDTPGQCTLRAAIAEFNAFAAQSSPPTVAFALPGCGAAGQPACVITPASALPAVSRAMVIDAQTQPGWTMNPIVTLRGSAAGGSAGLTLAAADTGVRGMIVQQFNGWGINVQSAAVGAVVQGNWIGIDAAGAAAGNAGGVSVEASGVLIGGSTPAMRNLIARNGVNGLELQASATGTIVRGNWFGLAPDGVSARGNGNHGIRSRAGSSATIGGTVAGQGNLFAASTIDGVALEGTGGTIQGNSFGLGADGSTPVPIGRHGVYIMSGAWIVGGNGPGEANVVAGNGGAGVLLSNGARATLRGNRISGNTLLGIDLGHSGAINSGVGTGVNANDGTIDAAQANNGMDHPVFTGAGVNTDGTALTVSGYIGTGTGQAVFAGARVELFRAAPDPSGYGEGQIYLGALTADADGRFAGTVSFPAGAATVGDTLTATATDAAGNTSEFGPQWTTTTLAALAPAGFNVFETDTAANALTGVIRSKTGGAAASLAVIALDNTGSALHAGFTGSVALEWLDARDDSGAATGSCRASWVPMGSAGSVSFSSNARTTVNLTPPPSAKRTMRLRLRYDGPAGTVTACSSDAFAVRPASLVLAASDGDAASPGLARALDNTLASGGVVHRAGRPFTLTLRALDATGAVMTGYDGVPTLAATACLLPAGCTAGPFSVGTVAATAGVAVANDALYGEVGAIALTGTDNAYADVDAADTPAAARQLQSVATPVGRFVPDSLVASVAAPGVLATANASCMASGTAATFYGQGIGWQTAPRVIVTARNAQGDTTRHWQGPLMKITATSGVVPAMTASGTAGAALGSTFGTLAVTGLGDGRARIDASTNDLFLLQAPGGSALDESTPGWQYSLSITDSAEAAEAGNPTFATTATQGPVGFSAGGRFVSGRVALTPGHGDARSGVRMLLQLQRYTPAGWVTMTEDRGCVTVAPQQLALSAPAGVFQTAGVCAAPVAGGVTTAGGRAWLAFAASPGGAPGRLLAQVAGASPTGTACSAGGLGTPAQPLGQPWLMPGGSGPQALAIWGVPKREAVLRRETW